MRFRSKTDQPVSADVSAEITVGLQISDSERTGAAVWILRIILSVCGIIGSVMSFVSAVYPRADIKPFVLSAVFFSITACAAALIKKGGWVLIASEFLIFAAFFIRMREDIVIGFMRISNIYLSMVRMRYRDTDFFDISYYEGDIGHAADLFLISAVILISITVTASVIYRTSFTCVFLVTFPPAELVLYYGLVPGYIWMGMLICCWLGAAAAEFSEFPVSGTGNHLPVYRRVSSQSAAAAAVLFLICFCFSAVFAEVSGYSRPERFDELKNSISRYMRTFSWEKFTNDLKSLRASSSAPSGATDQGKLGRQDTVSFNNSVVLKVKLPKSAESVYLKSFNGTNYTGSSWLEENSDQKKKLAAVISESDLNNFSIPIMDGYFWQAYSAYTGDSLRVNNIEITKTYSDDKFAYLPYYTVPGGLSVISYNGIWADDPGTNYSVEVYGIYSGRKRAAAEEILSGKVSADEFSGGFAKIERIYREYVHDEYLGIPDHFTAADYIYDFSDTEDPLTESDQIKNWLETNCRYDLSVGKLPFGEDFAQYFLMNTRRGSCTHFATAAALLCRYRGIPARYCEGYIIKPEDFPEEADYGDIVETEITDTRAHAWIEIYIDGCGWYPCEMTPGYGSVYDGSDDTSEPDTSEITTLTENTTESASVTESVTETEKITETELTDDDDDIISETSAEFDDTEEESLPPEIPEQKRPSDLRLLYAAAAAAGVCAAVYLRYFAVISRRKRIFGEGTPNEKALTACRVFMKICAFKSLRKSEDMTYEEYAAQIGKSISHISEEQAAEVINAGLSAEFGRGEIDADTASKAAETVMTFAGKVYSDLNAAGKFAFRFIFCLY